MPPTPAIPRRLSLIAGLVVLVVAAIRHLRSRGTVERMAMELAHPAEQAIIAIVWHSLTAIMFAFGILLIVSAWRSRGFARATAIGAVLVFGLPAVVMGAIAGAHLGDPLAFAPIFAFGLATILSLVAFVRA